MAGEPLGEIVPRLWIIVQSRAHIEAALRSKPEFREEARWLATTPDGFFCFGSYDIAGRALHHFSTESDLRPIAEQNFALVSSLVSELDSRLREGGYGADFLPFRALEFQLKCNADSIRFALAEFVAFLAEEDPSELVCYSNARDSSLSATKLHPKPPPDLAAHNLYTDAGSAIDVILHHANLPITVTIERLDPAEANQSKSSWLSTAKSLFNPNLVTRGRRGGIGSILPFARRPKQGPRILVVGECPNASAFLDYAALTGKASIDRWTHFRFRGCSGKLSDAIPRTLPRRFTSAEPLLRRGGLVQSQNSSDSPADRIFALIMEWMVLELAGSTIPALADLYVYSAELIGRLQPDFAVATTLGRSDVQVVAQAARQADVPLISFQHGGGYGFMSTPWLSLTDLRADVCASLGDSVGDGIKSCALPPREGDSGFPSFVNVGWSDFTPALPSDGGPTVLYAPTGLMGDYRYGPYHDMPDVRYCEMQRALLDTIASIEGVRVLFRFHPKDKVYNPIREIAAGISGVEVVSPGDESFVESLQRCSVIVLDAPTTTLLEALGAGRPIVYFDAGIFKWTTEGKHLSKEVCDWVDTSDGWESRLKQILSRLLSSGSSLNTGSRFEKAYADPDFRPDRLLRVLLGQSSVPDSDIH